MLTIKSEKIINMLVFTVLALSKSGKQIGHQSLSVNHMKQNIVADLHASVYILCIQILLQSIFS